MIYLVRSSDIVRVGNAIRDLIASESPLVWPAGFVGALNNIPKVASQTFYTSGTERVILSGRYLTGVQTIKAVFTKNIKAENIKAGVSVAVGDDGDDDRIIGVTGTFTADANATSGDILSGKTAYVNGVKVTGNIPSKAATTYNVSTTDQTVPAGQYTSGVQTFRGVTTSNIEAGNIKAGVTVKVGDAGDDDRIKGVTGTFTSDANATAGDILPGKSGYVNGNKISGSMTTKAATTYNTSSSDQTIAAGQYLSGAQTIRKVTTSGISAGNIKAGVTVKVGDAGDDDRIAGVTGTFTSDGTAAAGDMLSGKIAYVNGNKITGNIPSKAATTYTPTESAQTISAGQYLSGAQTISAVSSSYVGSAITRKAATTYTPTESVQTIASGQYLTGAQTISAIPNNYVGSGITQKSATTYNTSTSDQTISAGQYLSGAQTIRKVTTSNIEAGNIKAGVTIKVGDTGDDDRIKGVTGTFTSDGTAVAGNILSGKTAYVNGNKITGTIASKAAATITPTESAQEIASGQYLSGKQTISAIPSTYIGSSITRKAATSYTPTETAQTISGGQYLEGAQTIKAISSTYIGSGVTRKAAATYTPTESAQTISAGQYLDGAQTISAISSTYVGSGVTRKGAATYTPTESQQTISANQYLTGAQTISAISSTYVGSAVPRKAATTYKAITSGKSIASGTYLTGKQTISAPTADIVSLNVKSNQNTTIPAGYGDIYIDVYIDTASLSGTYGEYIIGAIGDMVASIDRTVIWSQGVKEGSLANPGGIIFEIDFEPDGAMTITKDMVIGTVPVCIWH